MEVFPAFTDGYTISDSYGDGIGTIGWYSALVDQETIYNYSIKQQMRTLISMFLEVGYIRLYYSIF